MKARTITAILLLLAFAGGLTSCKVTKNQKDNEYLLIKNKFKISHGKITSDELSGYLQQKPNSKLFGLFRANLAFYNWGSKGKDSKFKKWLRTGPGAEPVLLDTALTAISMKQMGLFLANKGYFQSKVSDSVKYRKKKATVYYKIDLTTPYRIRSVAYRITDTVLARYVFADSSKCRIRKGETYDAYILESERTRITGNLMNHGFYHFTASFIFFHIDSTAHDRKMDVRIEITNPVVPSFDDFATFVESRHTQYSIDRIFIYPNIDLLQSDTIRLDTVTKTYREFKRDSFPQTYYFLNKGKFSIRPRTLTQSVFLKTGQYYNLDDINRTYSQLSSLQVYKYINIHFTESKKPGAENNDLLDCHIRLSRSAFQSFSISGDGTNSAGDLGVQGNLIYTNRNIFSGAQLLCINLNTATQMQGSIESSAEKSLFNTIELGATASLTFPQFLIPIKPERLAKKYRPKTTISVGYNYQLKIDYTRHTANISFGYNWAQNEKLRHRVNPVEILFVKVLPDSSFSAYLDQLTDKRLKNQYTNHVIAGLKYTLTYNSQDVNRIKDYFYIRSNFETAGNLIYGIDYLTGAKRNSEGFYTVFNIPYSMFARPDFDFRYYHMVSKNTSMVYRGYAGIAIPYANSVAIPFEKAFFGGGANDIRGWKMGTLGPGSYKNDTLNSFDQTGDMLFQINLEYRFPVYGIVRSSVFLDAGNIWLLKDNVDFPGGTFRFDTFLSQVAIDAGLGIRADFDFFILRLDPAIRLRVPSYADNGHWYFSKLRISDIIWNFGIGYPF